MVIYIIETSLWDNTVCIKSNEPLLWCWYQTVLLHATQSTYDAPRPPTSKMYANIFNRSMQERVCVPVASGVWFSSLEFLACLDTYVLQNPHGSGCAMQHLFGLPYKDRLAEPRCLALTYLSLARDYLVCMVFGANQVQGCSSMARLCEKQWVQGGYTTA